MKFLIVLLVVLVGVFVWRNNRRTDRVERDRTAAKRRAGQPKIEDMVRCPVCALHLPAADAVPGAGGTLYCSAGHRQQAEG